jgi:hypothetical protein
MTTSKPTRYAEGTKVPISRSREEVEKLLMRYGASAFMYGNKQDRAAVSFEMAGRQYRIEVQYPAVTSFKGTPTQRQALYEVEQRRRWRGLVLIVKAKLEAASTGITTIEKEFFADEVVTGGRTVYQWYKPQLEEIYRSGKMPPLLPELSSARNEEIPDFVDGDWTE